MRKIMFKDVEIGVPFAVLKQFSQIYMKASNGDVLTIGDKGVVWNGRFESCFSKDQYVYVDLGDINSFMKNQPASRIKHKYKVGDVVIDRVLQQYAIIERLTPDGYTIKLGNDKITQRDEIDLKPQ